MATPASSSAFDTNLTGHEIHRRIMELSPVEPPIDDTVRFRSGRKRKTYRQRVDAVDHDDKDPVAEARPSQDAGPSEEQRQRQHTDDDEDGGVGAAVRSRNARRARIRGVGFSSDCRADGDVGTADRTLVLGSRENDDTGHAVTIADRFTHQTGLLAELDDKHMTEYVESRLSSRADRSDAASLQRRQQQQQRQEEQQLSGASQTDARFYPGAAVTRGRIMEVEVRLAEAAAPRTADPSSRDQDRGFKKKRLGKDGQPWRPRNRRASDDIERDRLVEDFLHENRLDVYGDPVPSSSTADAGEVVDGAADDRLAEQFRRQYLDDLAARRQKKKKLPARTTRQPRNEDILRGPKLGGSRNSRAAVRNALLQKAKEAKK